MALNININTTPGCDDELVTCARALLSALEPDDTPPLDAIVVATLDAGIEATTSGGIITVNREGEIYRRADLRAVACLLHHEHMHAAKNADERRAFLASMVFCEKHRAPDWLTSRVREEWRRHQQQEATQ